MCCQCKHRRAKYAVRSLGGPEFAAYTRCMGSVVMRVGRLNGALIKELARVA